MRENVIVRGINGRANNSLIFRQNIDDITFVCFSPLNVNKDLLLRRDVTFVKLHQM